MVTTSGRPWATAATAPASVAASPTTTMSPSASSERRRKARWVGESSTSTTRSTERRVTPASRPSRSVDDAEQGSARRTRPSRCRRRRPASRPRRRSSSPPRDVSSTTGRLRHRASLRMARVKPSPSMPSISMSVRTRSTRRLGAAVRGRRRPSAGGADLVAGALEDRPLELADGEGVVDDEDPRPRRRRPPTGRDVRDAGARDRDHAGAGRRRPRRLDEAIGVEHEQHRAVGLGAAADDDVVGGHQRRQGLHQHLALAERAASTRTASGPGQPGRSTTIGPLGVGVDWPSTAPRRRDRDELPADAHGGHALDGQSPPVSAGSTEPTPCRARAKRIAAGNRPGGCWSRVSGGRARVMRNAGALARRRWQPRRGRARRGHLSRTASRPTPRPETSLSGDAVEKPGRNSSSCTASSSRPAGVDAERLGAARTPATSTPRPSSVTVMTTREPSLDGVHDDGPSAGLPAGDAGRRVPRCRGRRRCARGARARRPGCSCTLRSSSVSSPLTRDAPPCRCIRGDVAGGAAQRPGRDRPTASMRARSVRSWRSVEVPRSDPHSVATSGSSPRCSAHERDQAQVGGRPLRRRAARDRRGARRRPGRSLARRAAAPIMASGTARRPRRRAMGRRPVGAPVAAPRAAVARRLEEVVDQARHRRSGAARGAGEHARLAEAPVFEAVGPAAGQLLEADASTAAVDRASVRTSRDTSAGDEVSATPRGRRPRGDAASSPRRPQPLEVRPPNLEQTMSDRRVVLARGAHGRAQPSAPPWKRSSRSSSRSATRSPRRRSNVAAGCRSRSAGDGTAVALGSPAHGLGGPVVTDASRPVRGVDDARWVAPRSARHGRGDGPVSTTGTISPRRLASPRQPRRRRPATGVTRRAGRAPRGPTPGARACHSGPTGNEQRSQFDRPTALVTRPQALVAAVRLELAGQVGEADRRRRDLVGRGRHRLGVAGELLEGDDDLLGGRPLLLGGEPALGCWRRRRCP